MCSDALGYILIEIFVIQVPANIDFAEITFGRNSISALVLLVRFVTAAAAAAAVTVAAARSWPRQLLRGGQFDQSQILIWKIVGISWWGQQFRPTIDCDLENWRDYVVGAAISSNCRI